MSASKAIQDRVYQWAVGKNFTAPYGVLLSEQMSKAGRKFRSVTFGHARTLDCQVCIYGSTFILIRSSRHGDQLFRSESDMQAFLDTL